MSLLRADQLDQLARQPIPGTNPAGANVRLESAFEIIEREIAKLDSLTAEDPVRWDDVLVLSRQILEQQSKDMLVACYLTRALCESDLANGLLQGLTLTLGLASQFWETAYPPVKRVRGRSQAFEWLVEKCNPLLDRYQPESAQLEQVKTLETAVIALDDFLVEKMAASAPNLADLRQRFKRLRQGLEAERQPGSQVNPVPQVTAGVTRQSVAAAHSAPVPSASISTPGSIGAEKDVVAVYRACQEPLRSVSQYLRSKKLTDPEAYRINRFVTWLGINQLPAAVDGKTQLKPVPREKTAACQTMRDEQRWHDLIPEVETSIARSPYWLDGHRLVSEALQEMNASDARTAVIEGVRSFVARFPAIVNYSFADGTPFADDQTRQWLNREASAAQPTGSGSGIAVDTAHLSPRWQEAYEQAAALAVEKNVRGALALFQDGCAQSTSLREQSLWRFNQARFCVDHGLLGLAIPLLESLDRQMLEKGVDQWEPQITTKVLELLLRCYRTRDSAEVPEKRVEGLHARLCRYDLALAFDLSTH